MRTRVRLRLQQRLSVGIDGDELDALQPSSIIRLTALQPPPPTPTTLMRANDSDWLLKFHCFLPNEFLISAA
jgi:hypothetical protein